MSEVLILELTDPNYDKRLFIDLTLQYMKTTSSEHVVYINCFECQNKNKKNNFCTQHVLNLYFSCNSMNNLLSYCGSTDARMRASEKDLPVKVSLFSNLQNIFSVIFRETALTLRKDFTLTWHKENVKHSFSKAVTETGITSWQWQNANQTVEI